MLVFTMPARAKQLKMCLCAILLLTLISGNPFLSAAQVTALYTPYTKISVPPGESINYEIDVINNGKSISNAALSVNGLPKGWTATLKSGGWSINQISVLPRERKTVSLQVQVPLQINKGTYRFGVAASGIGQLPLTVIVSQKGAFKTEFSSAQPNMEGAANSAFTYAANLKNGTGADQVYALHSQAPPGWNVTFKADYKQVSSVNVEANKTKDITIEVDPPDQVPAGTYKVPLVASTNGTSAELMLDLVITGSYGMELSTPTGLLSTAATAGADKRVELTVRNTGSTALKNVGLQAAAPLNWEVSFEPQNIATLAPGAAVPVSAIIKADKKAITGDYVTTIEAKSPEIASKADLRVSVETSLYSGWLGLLTIMLAVGSVYYMVRKYGRR